MKIVITSLYFYPELTGIGVYSYDLAKFLAKNGHKVNVFTTFPFYPEWNKQKEYSSKVFYEENIEGINIFRCYTYVPEKPGTISRIMHELVFSILVLQRLLFLHNCDLLICISPPFFSMVMAAVRTRLLRNVPLLIHIQDLQPDAAIELGMIKNKHITRILKHLELFSYNSARFISTIGNGMNDNLMRKGIEKRKLMLLSNWVNDEEIAEHSKNPLTFKNKYHLEDDYMVLHSGSIGEKHGLSTILHTAQLAQQKNENIKFVIAGAGAQKQLLIEKKEKFGLNNVIFLGVQPKAEFYDMLLSADISLVMLRKEVKEIAIPSKLLNIIGTGCPVIASVNAESEIAKILKSLPSEVIVPPEDPEALFNKIVQFKNNMINQDLIKCAEKELAKKLFSSEIILPEILRQIEERFGKQKKEDRLVVPIEQHPPKEMLLNKS